MMSDSCGRHLVRRENPSGEPVRTPLLAPFLFREIALCRAGITGGPVCRTRRSNVCNGSNAICRKTRHCTSRLSPVRPVGRTGPCTDAIVRSGVKSVVIGATDPNPRHRGRGLEILQNAGIEVRSGVLAEECAGLNEAFNKWIATGIPFVIAKCGMSLDGRLTRPKKEGHWITSAASRRHAQGLRAESDAILVGAETLRTDNPHLTIRGPGNSRQPIRVVITRSGKLPRNARIFTDRQAKKSLVYRDVPLAAVLADLGKKDVVSLTIEGGGEVLGHALDQRLIDKVQIYVAPIFTGGGVPAFGAKGARSTSGSAHLDRIEFKKIGPDFCVTGYPKYPAMAAAE